jgi:hypothetical protein
VLYRGELTREEVQTRMEVLDEEWLNDINVSDFKLQSCPIPFSCISVDRLGGGQTALNKVSGYCLRLPLQLSSQCWRTCCSQPARSIGLAVDDEVFSKIRDHSINASLRSLLVDRNCELLI